MEIGKDIHILGRDRFSKNPADCGAIGKDGRVNVLHYEFWQQFSREEIALFCNRHAVYHLPTIEFIDWLRVLLGGALTVEIGAGSGVLSESLSITATDNHMQTWPDVRQTYELTGQPTIAYGANVICMEAIEAIRRYRPAVCLGAWITHRYDPKHPAREGNAYGPDEREILRNVGSYVLIGNTVTHRNKPLLSVAHRTYNAPGLLSRSMSGGKDVVWIWGQGLPGEKEAATLCR